MSKDKYQLFKISKPWSSSSSNVLIYTITDLLLYCAVCMFSRACWVTWLVHYIFTGQTCWTFFQFVTDSSLTLIRSVWPAKEMFGKDARPQKVESWLTEIIIRTSLLHHRTAQSYYNESLHEKQAWIIGRLEYLRLSVQNLIEVCTSSNQCIWNLSS